MKTTLTRLAVAGAMLFSFSGVADAAVKVAPLTEVNKAAGKKVETGKRVRIETTRGTFEAASCCDTFRGNMPYAATATPPRISAMPQYMSAPIGMP